MSWALSRILGLILFNLPNYFHSTNRKPEAVESESNLAQKCTDSVSRAGASAYNPRFFPLNTFLVLLGEITTEWDRGGSPSCPSLLRSWASSMSFNLFQHPAEEERVIHAWVGPWPWLRPSLGLLYIPLTMVMSLLNFLG